MMLGALLTEKGGWSRCGVRFARLCIRYLDRVAEHGAVGEGRRQDERVAVADGVACVADCYAGRLARRERGDC